MEYDMGKLMKISLKWKWYLFILNEKTLSISASELMEHIEIEFNAFKVNTQWVYTPSKLKICKGGKNIGSFVGSDNKCI